MKGCRWKRQGIVKGVGVEEARDSEGVTVEEARDSEGGDGGRGKG